MKMLDNGCGYGVTDEDESYDEKILMLQNSDRHSKNSNKNKKLHEAVTVVEFVIVVFALATHRLLFNPLLPLASLLLPITLLAMLQAGNPMIHCMSPTPFPNTTQTASAVYGCRG